MNKDHFDEKENNLGKSRYCGVTSHEFISFCNSQLRLLHRYNTSAALLSPFLLRRDSLQKKKKERKRKPVGPTQGDGARTSITLDFGDGHALTYSNVSSIEDGIKHVYKAVGIYRVTATGENSLGSETTTLFLHVTCEA